MDESEIYLNPSASQLDAVALMREVIRLHAAGVQWKARAESEAQRADAAEARADELQRRLNDQLARESARRLNTGESQAFDINGDSVGNADLVASLDRLGRKGRIDGPESTG